MSFSFRPLATSDLQLLHRWFNAPHAARWFGRTFAEIESEYSPAVRGEETFAAAIVSFEGAEIGLFNWGRFGDAPEMARHYEVADPDAVNCDVLIGEARFAHRGLGPDLIRAALKELVFSDQRASRVIIDPVPDNAIAIRAYEKAGFRFLRALPEDGEGNALYLMELSREDFLRQRPAPPLVVRPARAGELATAAAIDDDACEAYREVGLPFDFEDDHPFARMEHARWARSAALERMLFACDGGAPIGLLVLDHVDGRPHLEQLSVRRSHMRRGVGRELLLRALRWSVRAGELWITTYEHVAWNAPWYSRMGFEPVADADAPRELCALLDAARGVLPKGERQIAMVCRGPRLAQWMRAG